jgi:hypothetical protein
MCGCVARSYVENSFSLVAVGRWNLVVCFEHVSVGAWVQRGCRAFSVSLRAGFVRLMLVDFLNGTGGMPLFI